MRVTQNEFLGEKKNGILVIVDVYCDFYFIFIFYIYIIYIFIFDNVLYLYLLKGSFTPAPSMYYFFHALIYALLSPFTHSQGMALSLVQGKLCAFVRFLVIIVT